MIDHSVPMAPSLQSGMPGCDSYNHHNGNVWGLPVHTQGTKCSPLTLWWITTMTRGNCSSGDGEALLLVRESHIPPSLRSPWDREVWTLAGLSAFLEVSPAESVREKARYGPPTSSLVMVYKNWRDGILDMCILSSLSPLCREDVSLN